MQIEHLTGGIIQSGWHEVVINEKTVDVIERFRKVIIIILLLLIIIIYYYFLIFILGKEIIMENFINFIFTY